MSDDTDFRELLADVPPDIIMRLGLTSRRLQLLNLGIGRSIGGTMGLLNSLNSP